MERQANPLKEIRTYHDASEIKLKKPFRLLWLASWYPSRTDPYNGDFIQRHAEAVSRLTPVVLIHTIHDNYSPTPVRYEVSECGALTEVYVYFRHNGNLGSITSRIFYNLRFFHYTKTLLSALVRCYGRPECIHVHVPMKMGRVAIWAKGKWSVPFFVSEHSAAYQDGPEDSFKNRSFYYRYHVRQILRKARAVSNVSGSLGLILQQISGRNDIDVIRNVADHSRFFYDPVDLPVFTFVHVSTLKEQKNIQGILRTFARLYQQRQDFCLHMVGGDEGALKSIRVDYPNASWLTLHGTVGHDQVPRHMQQAHCMVMFSRDENFPCVIVEGLGCGLPVITSDAGGCAEAIEQGNGLVVHAGDEEELLQALQHVITHYHTYDRVKIASEAAARYSYEKVANDFLDFYKKSGIKI
jgi:glycosyltransferase involved in cell wall biosynthesis